MADVINGFFGQAAGPFKQNVQIFNILNQQSGRRINYISKLGIHCFYNFDLDIKGQWYPRINVRINNKEFIIGKTGILELEDKKKKRNRKIKNFFYSFFLFILIFL